MIVTSSHLRTIPYFRSRPGFCLPKSRTWFKRHDLDFADFLRNGIEEEVLLATGCGMASALVQWARACEVEKTNGE